MNDLYAMTWTIFALGAICAGFIQGLTGFAFALIAMSFWVWVLSPQLAAPLVVFASVWCHLISLAQDQQHSRFSAKHLLLPYIIAGIVGIPLGSFLLQHINHNSFKILLGLFLVLWSPLMWFAPRLAKIEHAGRGADVAIGFIGGILGGLGGFSGSVPSAWLMLKNLPKQQQRYILRHFNFAIQIFTIALYLWQGTIQLQQWPYFLSIMLFVSIPAILGARLFYKISEQQFKRIILALLFASGCFLTLSVVVL